MTDYNIIDRISAIKLELEYETENVYSILIAIRNILHQTDGMSYLEIKFALTEYFNLNPQSNININIIDLITSPSTANNNSMMTILLNFFNQQNTQISESNDSDDDLEYSSDTDSDTSNEEILEETNNQHMYNNEIQPIYDITGNNITDYINSNTNNYNQYLSHIFYGSGNIQFNNSFEPNISNNINSILTLSNLMNEGLNNFQPAENSNSLNLYTQLFHNINNNQNQNQNDDIPIVITNESYDKLIKCDYKDIDDKIKSKNLKCMITLDDFKDEDKVILLPCEHVFKLEEITSWLKDNSYKCPSCRNSCGNYYAKLT